MMNLLLLSNSTNAGGGYLEHAWDTVLPALAGATEILFIPYALADHDGYTEKAAVAFAAHGVAVTGIHRHRDGAAAIADAPAVFVGGGNTFRLLNAIKQKNLAVALHAHTATGGLYMGASAGTNIAAPTIRTTNDMPIVFPEGFDALGLVPFQINAHYLDPDPHSTHAGETRELRLREYLEENERPVLALREGTWLRVAGGHAQIGGQAVNREYGPALWFARGEEPREVSDSVDWAFHG